MLQAPVLFLIFNRPETTKRVFEAIRLARPSHLFIAADGPRKDHAGESEICSEVRKIATSVDWPCEVKTLFRKANLGCGLAVSEAINWFFENVEAGIILEDDCLPEQEFFIFCQVILEKYKCEEKIMMIGGTNHLFNHIESSYTYYFSNIISIWGWATWRRAWQQMKLQVVEPNICQIQQRYRNKLYGQSIIDMLMATINGKIDTWDIQWAYTIIKYEGVAVVPYRNQVKNIGFQGSHTQGINDKHPFFDMPTQKLDLLDIRHPEEITIDMGADEVDCGIIIKYEKQQTSLSNRFKSLFSDALRSYYRQVKAKLIK